MLFVTRLEVAYLCEKAPSIQSQQGDAGRYEHDPFAPDGCSGRGEEGEDTRPENEQADQVCGNDVETLLELHGQQRQAGRYHRSKAGKISGSALYAVQMKDNIRNGHAGCQCHHK